MRPEPIIKRITKKIKNPQLTAGLLRSVYRWTLFFLYPIFLEQTTDNQIGSLECERAAASPCSVQPTAEIKAPVDKRVWGLPPPAV